MAKSYKLAGDNYIDSTSIAHNKKKLSEVLGTVLYENAAGSNQTIPLNDNISNYTYLEIFYVGYDLGRGSVKLYKPTAGQFFEMTSSFFDNNVWENGNFKIQQCKLLENSISYSKGTQLAFDTANTKAQSVSQNVKIKIYAVVGYK